MALDGDDVALTGQIVRLAIRVHTRLGPGLLESAYEACLAYELRLTGLGVETQLPMPFTYEGHRVECGYRLDMLVDRRVVVENKTVERILKVHEAQLLSYLRLGDFRTGLLMNWRALHLRNGIRRFVNGA